MSLEIINTVIDYLEPTKGGVPILISSKIDIYIFSNIYWIHPTEDSVLECCTEFLKIFGVSETNKLPFLDEMKADIEIIINRDEIFKSLI